jgi:hypothetical protein
MFEDVDARLAKLEDEARTEDPEIARYKAEANRIETLLNRALKDEGPEGLVALNLLRKAVGTYRVIIIPQDATYKHPHWSEMTLLENLRQEKHRLWDCINGHKAEIAALKDRLRKIIRAAEIGVYGK